MSKTINVSDAAYTYFFNRMRSAMNKEKKRATITQMVDRLIEESKKE